MKEYLVKDAHGKYRLTDHHSGFDIERLIEIPQGANYAATNGHGIFFSDKNDFIPDLVVWVRESLNDKIATAEVARQQSKNIDATLAERQSQYGSFEDVAFVTENIMATLAKVRSNRLHDLPHTHRMALYMIASKMARIVNGDFNHLDSWHDIGGYSKLIEDLIVVDQ